MLSSLLRLVVLAEIVGAGVLVVTVVALALGVG